MQVAEKDEHGRYRSERELADIHMQLGLSSETPSEDQTLHLRAAQVHATLSVSDGISSLIERLGQLAEEQKVALWELQKDWPR